MSSNRIEAPASSDASPTKADLKSLAKLIAKWQPPRKSVV